MCQNAPVFRLIFTAIAVLFAAHSSCSTEPLPNLVLFLADDLSWTDCSINGGREIRTPNMDRVARDGMTFSHAFVASPSCAPSRAALLTGMNCARNGAMFNHAKPHPEIKKWPAYFRELGYEVVAIGKTAHYAQVQDYGFDYVSHFKYHEDDCIAAAVDWLAKRESTKPLCLIVGTNWPHVPWPKTSEYGREAMVIPSGQVSTEETRAARTLYAQAVAHADRDLGLVYDAARRKFTDNVCFLFTADHGAQWPFAKWNCYDAGIRTPLVAVWPGKVASGSRTSAMVSWLDILPTCLELAGAKPAADFDGKSFLPVLRGEQAEHHPLIFTTHSGDGRMNEFPIRSVRSRDWKYIRNLDPTREFHSHIDRAEAKPYWDSWLAKAKTDPEAKAIVDRYLHRPAEELYDLAADPNELHNLATEPAQAERLKEMRGQLDTWMRAQGDQGLATPPLVR
jgi:N-sulfoglucosamine sulfohydrolase